MPTFIKTGYWEKAVKNYKGWLNLEDIVFNVIPSQEGNAGKFLTTDGSTLSWASVLSSNIYTADGILAADRTVTFNNKKLIFRNDESIISNYTFSVGVPTGTSAAAGPASLVYEGQFQMNASNFGASPNITRVWGRNQTGSPMTLRTTQVIADITSESTGITSIINSTFSARRGSTLDTSSTAVFLMSGIQSIVGSPYTGSALTNSPIVTTTQTALEGTATNNTGTVTNAYILRSTSFTAANSNCKNTVISNYYGLSVEATVGLNGGSWTATITNYYGVFLATPAIRTNGSIVNRWGLYAPDAAMTHHFNGKLLIGTATAGTSNVRISGLPTSSAGLVSGELWNNAGVVNIVP
jgi:hypothetical protein